MGTGRIDKMTACSAKITQEWFIRRWIYFWMDKQTRGAYANSFLILRGRSAIFVFRNFPLGRRILDNRKQGWFWGQPPVFLQRWLSVPGLSLCPVFGGFKWVDMCMWCSVVRALREDEQETFLASCRVWFREEYLESKGRNHEGICFNFKSYMKAGE